MSPKIGKSKPTDDRQIVTVNGWAVATDGTQWTLQRLRGQRWLDVMFVRSTKIILAQCMKEKGVPPNTAKRLLAALPNTFDPLQQGRETPTEVSRSDYSAPDGVKHHPAPAGLTQPGSHHAS